MHIGIIAPPWVAIPPPAYGGTEAVIDTLVRGLVQEGHHVELFASGDSTADVATRYIVARAPGIDVGGSALEFQHVAAAYAAFATMDIIHDHTVLGPIYAAGRSITARVTTNHNPFIEPFNSIFRAAGASIPVIAISQHHAESAGGLPIAGVIHHGVDASQFPLGTGGGDYALFLGRMIAEKGAHRAIQIAKAAGMPIVLAGKMHSRAETEYFEEVVAPLLGDGAAYVGEVDAKTKLELLSEAKCLLNPIAWAEPFGMVMIESFACGTPVLALAHGAAPEIIEHNRTGFLSTDEDGLIAGLARLEELDRDACRRAAEGKFSAKRMVEEHVALYERLIAQHGESSRGPGLGRADIPRDDETIEEP